MIRKELSIAHLGANVARESFPGFAQLVMQVSGYGLTWAARKGSWPKFSLMNLWAAFLKSPIIKTDGGRREVVIVPVSYNEARPSAINPSTALSILLLHGHSLTGLPTPQEV